MTDDLIPLPADGDLAVDPFDLVPPSLGDPGRLWLEAYTGRYESGLAEATAAARCAVLVDALAELDAALAAHGLVTADGKPSPLLVERRLTEAQLTRSLGLVETPLDSSEPSGGSSLAASRRGSKAAAARWRAARGGGQ